MNTNGRKRNEFSPAVLVLILLFFIFPPFALLGAVFLAAHNQSKKNTQGSNKDLRADLENIKRSGMAAKEKILRRLKEEDAAERPYKSHPHTPVSYSYDSCAKEKRLEQLKVLKSAGLLDEMEYSQRKQEILAMR